MICNELPSDQVTLSKSSDQQFCSKDGLRDVEEANGGGERKERACDSLVMCIITTLNQGLRNGGGIGDILRAPSSTVSLNSITFSFILKFPTDFDVLFSFLSSIENF